jgi:acetylornithine aminotransferase
MTHTLRCTGYERTDAQIVRALGCTLTTADGRDIIDMESGVWAVGLGHNHPRIHSALRSQLDRITHIGYRVSASIQDEAAAALLESAGLVGGRCVFLSSGSEAVEFAAQAARRITGKPLLLALANTFLGSYGSVARRDPDEWHPFDWAPCATCSPDQACSEACPQLREIPFDRLGGFVFEAGSAHVRFPPAKLVAGLRDAVRAHGGRIVANEVTTGMGRTGRLFGFDHFDLDPDLVALGKGLGNGYPVSAVLLRDATAEALLSTGFRYAQSHQNDPLGCAVALEVLRTLRDERLIERCAEIGAAFLRELERLAATHAPIVEGRGHGLLTAIALAEDGGGFSRDELVDRLFDRGFLVGYKVDPSLVRFFPPLTVPETDLARLLQSLDEVLR